MKKILFVTLVLASFTSFSQYSFDGIRWALVTVKTVSDVSPCSIIF